MALSGDNLFIHYNSVGPSNPRLALINIPLKGKQTTAPIGVGQNMTLVPVSGGGVALVNMVSCG